MIMTKELALYIIKNQASFSPKQVKDAIAFLANNGLKSL